ncbi:UNKNOWN [Stylonychia lemnae]|uniref:Uncharacterized protein n=1 Tax=Stylonychia lemnae TaxID=5949 RepID=A0A077ZT68_STYLE|nr:UNKNOWN [Stylonychia lemnae]|eukprot:CDW73078.1 UNKNOWN [Stylonychia lemnae]
MKIEEHPSSTQDLLNSYQTLPSVARYKQLKLKDKHQRRVEVQKENNNISSTTLPFQIGDEVLTEPINRSMSIDSQLDHLNQESSFDLGAKSSSKNKRLLDSSFARSNRTEDYNKVLDVLRQRNCKENIKKYKEELEQIKYYMNPFTTIMSHSNIETKVNKIVLNNKTSKTLNDTQKSEVRYQKLREYLRLYKQRLYLVPKHQIMDDDKDMRGLDYNSYKDLQSKNMDIVEIVQQHKDESDELITKMGISLSFDKRSQNHKNQNGMKRVSSKVYITEKKIDSSLDKNYKSFLGTGPNAQSLNDYVAYSGDSFANIRSHASLNRMEDQEIFKIAEQIQKQHFEEEFLRKQRFSKNNSKFGIEKYNQVNSSQVLQKKSSTAQIQLRPHGINKSAANIKSSNMNITNEILYTDTESRASLNYPSHSQSRNQNKKNSQEQLLNAETRKNNNPVYNKNMNQISDIYRSCEQMKKETRKISRKYRHGHQVFRDDLNKCKSILRKSQQTNKSQALVMNYEPGEININSQQFVIKAQQR